MYVVCTTFCNRNYDQKCIAMVHMTVDQSEINFATHSLTVLALKYVQSWY